MLAKVFLGLFVVLFCIRAGESIKCYSHACSNYTTTHHPTCAPPKIITCQMDHNSLVPPDRCLIQRVIGEPEYPGKRILVQHEVRGCANHLECKTSRFCEEAKNHGNIKHCETSCCEGDLCNREGPVVTQVADPKGPMGPQGSNLYCFACSNVTEPDQTPEIKCSRPIKQQCGFDPLTGRPQDRCLTIVMSKKLQWPIGKVLYQEMRNCSSLHYCGQKFCDGANVTGSLATCKADCCIGNTCNNEGIAAMTSTVTPMTAVQGDKFAREGIQTFPPTKEDRPTGSSPAPSFDHLKTFLGILTVTRVLLG